MLSASTIEMLIDPGIKHEVDDFEPVMKHKNFDKSSFVALSINRYSIWTTLLTCTSTETGGLNKDLR